MASSNSSCYGCWADTTMNSDEGKTGVSGLTILVYAAFLLFVVVKLIDCLMLRDSPQPPQNSDQQQASSSTDHVVINIKESENDDECVICCSEAKENVPSLPCMWRVLPECHHKFHADCIRIWLAINSTCPLCRKSIH